MGAGKRNRTSTKRAKKADIIIKHTAAGTTVTEVSNELGRPGVPSDSNLPAIIPPPPRSERFKQSARTLMDILDERRNSKRTVTLLRDHTLDYPELELRIFVMPDWDVRDDESRFAKMFARSRCRKAYNVNDADLVVFGGGSDVDPRLYNESVHPQTYFNEERDNADIEVYLKCVEDGIPMFGVCRGAQFLHVMQGGKLYQHVDGHNGEHTMWAIGKNGNTGQRIERISSVHHQMVKRQNGMDVLGMSGGVSSVRYLNADEQPEEGKHMDIEAFFYREVCAIGVQGHPEYDGYNYYTKWCLDQIQQYVIENPDIHIINNRRRMDPNLLKFRQSLLKYENVINIPAQEKK